MKIKKKNTRKDCCFGEIKDGEVFYFVDGYFMKTYGCNEESNVVRLSDGCKGKFNSNILVQEVNGAFEEE